jgi:hypothetical protein
MLDVDIFVPFPRADFDRKVDDWNAFRPFWRPPIVPGPGVLVVDYLVPMPRVDWDRPWNRGWDDFRPFWRAPALLPRNTYPEPPVSRMIFAPKLLDESALYTFDFSSRLGVGESISSATCTAAVYSGTDASPGAIVSGAASVSSPLVSQLFTGGVLGTTYVVKCKASTTFSQSIDLVAFLSIIPDAI